MEDVVAVDVVAEAQATLIATAEALEGKQTNMSHLKVVF